MSRFKFISKGMTIERFGTGLRDVQTNLQGEFQLQGAHLFIIS